MLWDYFSNIKIKFLKVYLQSRVTIHFPARIPLRYLSVLGQTPSLFTPLIMWVTNKINKIYKNEFALFWEKDSLIFKKICLILMVRNLSESISQSEET